MLNLFKSTDKRVLLINIEGMSVYTLHNEQLTNVARFSDEDAGHDIFRHYLREHPKTPVTLMVDSVTEDFSVETVAHVGPLDSGAFLKRKAASHFRGAEYRSARVIGREEEGRRDDRVLFSAITRNQVIEPWIRVLLGEEIPLRGITTPAYALAGVAREFSLLTSDHVLLVNWETSGIRQTFLVRGATEFSRLTPLPHLPPGANAELAAAMVESCNQSKEYLERIGLVSYGQKLDVHIITPHLNDHDFEAYRESRNFRLIMHHNSIDMMQIDRFSGPQATITAILLCVDWGVRSGELKNVYAPSYARRFYHLIQARRLIYALSLALVVLTGLVSTPLLLDGLERRANTERLRNSILPVQAQYDALRAQFPATPIPSEAMELAVRTHDTIRAQTRSPFAILAAISSVISLYPAIELTAFEWSLGPPQANQTLTTALLANEAVVSVDLYGVLLDSTSAQDSDTRLREFMESIEAIGGITVSPILVPVEPGPLSEVTTIIDDELVDAEFILNLRLET